jgi:hypothetical protein
VGAADRNAEALAADLRRRFGLWQNDPSAPAPTA